MNMYSYKEKSSDVDSISRSLTAQWGHKLPFTGVSDVLSSIFEHASSAVIFAIKFVLWAAANTWQNTDGKQRIICKFLASRNLCFSKRKCYLVPSNLAHAPPKQDNMRKARQQVNISSRLCQSQQHSQLCLVWCRFTRVSGWTLKPSMRSKSF